VLSEVQKTKGRDAALFCGTLLLEFWIPRLVAGPGRKDDMRTGKNTDKLLASRVIPVLGLRSRKDAETAIDCLIGSLRRSSNADFLVGAGTVLRQSLSRLHRRALPSRCFARGLSGYSAVSRQVMEDAEALCGLRDADAIVDWCHRAGAGVVALKLGADGVIGSAYDDRIRHRRTLTQA
jgi:hypothetical protein